MLVDFNVWVYSMTYNTPNPLRIYIKYFALIALLLCYCDNSGINNNYEVPLIMDQYPSSSNNCGIVYYHEDESDEYPSGIYSVNIGEYTVSYILGGEYPDLDCSGENIVYQEFDMGTITFSVYDLISESSERLNTINSNYSMYPSWYSTNSIIYSSHQGPQDSVGVWIYNYSHNSYRHVINRYVQYAVASDDTLRIVFIESATNNQYLAICNHDGTGYRRLLGADELNTFALHKPSFNGSGTQIVFSTNNTNDNDAGVYIYDMSLESYSEVIAGGTQPSWHNNDTMIIYTKYVIYNKYEYDNSNGYLWIYDILSKQSAPITSALTYGGSR